LGQASQRSRSIDYRRSLRLSLNCLSKRERRLRLPFSFGCKITKTPKGCNHSGLLTIRMSEHRMTAKEIIPQGFYVYLHRKATNGQVFYVGKGYGKRAWSKRRNAKWKNIVAKYGFIVEIAQSGLQELAAFELEKDLISHYGRESLCNLTDGGEGMAGFKYSDEFKAKVSIQSTKQFMSFEFRLKHSAAVSLAMTGKKATQLKKDSLKAAWSDETKRSRRLKAIRTACGKRYFCIEANITFNSLGHAAEWLRPQGKTKSKSATKIALVCQGKRKTAYGYTWRYA